MARQLVAERTAQHAGFTCTAYLTADPTGNLTIHCITRGDITYSKSTPRPTTYSSALTDLDNAAHSAPLT